MANKLLSLLAGAVLFTAAAVYAAAPEAPATLPAKTGDVTFNHKTHAAVKCDKCHVGKPEGGKIGKMEQKPAHDLCVACHKAEAKGPQKCQECHKKA